MVSKAIYKFEPDYTVSPGEVLEETLEARGIMKGDFANRCDLSSKTISLIINGKAPITPDTAILFERVLGVSSSIWLGLESEFSLNKAKEEQENTIAKKLENLKRFPLKELVSKGFISETSNKLHIAKDLLNFFAVGSFEALDNQINYYSERFRHSPAFKSTPEALSSWIRIAEVYADNIESESYNRNKFMKSLKEIREMTNESPNVFIPEIKRMFKESGVVFVIVPELKDVHLSGATKWISKDKALIVLSLRHKTNDHFWFNLFHEAAHILFHGKKEIYIDEVDKNDTLEEKQANKFASDILVPPKYIGIFKEVRPARDFILDLALKINIAPGIIVGRLQHDKTIPFNRFYDLKEKMDYTFLSS